MANRRKQREQHDEDAEGKHSKLDRRTTPPICPSPLPIPFWHFRKQFHKGNGEWLALFQPTKAIHTHTPTHTHSRTERERIRPGITDTTIQLVFTSDTSRIRNAVLRIINQTGETTEKRETTNNPLGQLVGFDNLT